MAAAEPGWGWDADDPNDAVREHWSGDEAGTYVVRFTVPVEVTVRLDASDADAASDAAHDIVSGYLPTLGTMTGDDRIVAVEGDLDGRGADSVTLDEADR